MIIDPHNDQFNQTLHRRLVRENQYMPSTTRVNGNLALRPCFIGARTSQAQVTGLLDSVLRIGKDLEDTINKRLKADMPSQ